MKGIIVSLELKELANDPGKVGEIFSAFMNVVAAVPFGNSDWQNRNAIINNERTPMRAYRHAALRITNRMNALIEAYYHLKRTDIELRQAEAELVDEKDPLKKELIALDIEQKRVLLPYTKKLIADAICEIESLSPIIESMGMVTREQFESEEGEHFAGKLQLSNDVANQADDLYKKIIDRVSLSALCSTGRT